jgi:hypothetical protein
MMNAPRCIAATSVAIAIALISAAALGQHGSVDPRYAGSYVFAGTVEAAQAQFRRALEPELSRIDPLLRMMGESMVQGRLPVPRRIDIGIDGDRIAVTIRNDGEAARTYESRAGYPSARRASTMTQLFRDGHLEQIVEYESGVRKYRIFTLDESGDALHFELVLTGAQRPFRFTASYRRAR